MTTKQISQIIMRALAGIAASVIIGLASSAYADNGTWTNLTTGGLWSNSANWQGGTIADSSGFTADFNQVNITADNIVKMDASHTLGNLIFGDTVTNSAAGWIVTNSAAGVILTLAGGTPTITVNALGSVSGTAKTATILTAIAGSSGLIKDGVGQLNLGAASGGNLTSGGTTNLVGGVSIKAGIFGLVGQIGAGNITIGDTAGGSTAAATLNMVGLGTNGSVPTYTNALVLGVTSGTLTINATTSGQLSLSGGVTGTNNLRIEENNPGIGTITFSTASLNNIGTIMNAGTGAAGTSVTISSVIGSNVTGVIQNGTTKLILSGANIYTGPTTITAGTLQLGNAGTTGSLSPSSAITNNGTLAFNRTDIITQGVHFASAIVGSGGLTQTGTGGGTTILTGTNSYTGATTASGGALVAALTTSLPNYNVAAKVVFSGGTIGAVMGDSANGWTTTQVDTLLSSATKTSGALGIDTSNGSITQWMTFDTANLGSALGLTKLGANTLTLNAANTYAGATYLNAGTLNLAHQYAVPTNSTVTMQGGTLVLASSAGTNFTFGGLAAASAGTGYNIGLTNSTGNAVALTVGGNNAVTTYAGVLSGAGSLTKSGTNTLTLSGANTFNGGLVIKAGTVTLGNATAGGAGSITLGAVGSADATLSLNGSITYGNVIALGDSSGTMLITQGSQNTTTLTGGVTGTGNLSFSKLNSNGGAVDFMTGILNNTGTITFAIPQTGQVRISSAIGGAVKGLILNSPTMTTGFLSLGAASSNFIGDTTLTAGNLRLQNTNALQNSVVKMNGGSITFGTSATVAITAVALGGLSGSGNINLNNTLTTPTAVNLTLGNSNAAYGGNTLNPTYSGILSNANGSASLTKVGTNTQTLAGANTYSGGTTVSNGTLWVSNTSGSGTGSGAVSVATNATLGGIGMITGTVTVASGGILSPGTNSVGRLTVGSLKLDANASFAIQIVGPGSNNWCVVSTGAVDIASSILSLTVAPGYVPKFNSTFTIIQNVKGDAVIGTFAIGTKITVPALTAPFEISTTGGAGNDVVLRYTGGGGTMIRFM